MVEREMQELLWQHPERLLNESLTKFAWETSSAVGRADLVFEDRHGRLLIIEVKRGKLPRGAIDQLLDYFGMMKQRYPAKPVEMMVVANSIPTERRLTCESRDIECREISEKTFRDVAAEVGYAFASEANTAKQPVVTAITVSTTPSPTIHVRDGHAYEWSFKSAGPSSGDQEEFLSRCDEEGKSFFASLFEAQKASSKETKITWKHESGFSLQFYFHRIGYAPIVWGFPAKNREGKHIRQRLDFPFDFSVRANVPEDFINSFGASLAAILPFSGGGKRPSLAIAGLNSSEAAEVISTIFGFAAQAANKSVVQRP
jgi:hypothetical protein